jgi:hypothetical protein
LLIAPLSHRHALIHHFAAIETLSRRFVRAMGTSVNHRYMLSVMCGQESGTSGIDDRTALPLFSERKWRPMQRDGTKTIAFPKIERAEFRLADARGILQHGLEDWH